MCRYLVVVIFTVEISCSVELSIKKVIQPRGLIQYGKILVVKH